MKNRWLTRFKKQEDKNKFKDSLKSARYVIEVLKEILEEDIETSTKTMRKEVNYETPNWELRMADKLSEQRTLQRVIDLLPKEK